MKKRQVFDRSVLNKPLATSSLGQLLVLYLNLLALSGARITDKMLKRITDRVLYCLQSIENI